MSARDALSAETGEEYLWDYAYYNGHYYVYYGVAPCVMFYLPFYLLTGNMLPNTLLIILCSIFLYIGGYFLIRQFAVRIGEVPYAVQIELLFCVFFGSLILYFLNQPDAYAVPVVCGGVFTIWGLFLWLKAEETDKISFLFLGSLCMAIVGGCRPHMLIYGLASIPIFGKKFREMLSEADKRKRGIVSIVAFILPYILVGSGLMLYNASRFGDPFDFGQGYNLTIQDGTNPVFSWDKVWIGIYEYLLKLPRLEYSFPFLSIPGDGTGNNMLGHSVLYMEYVFGGLLSCSPVCLFIFGLKKYGRGAEKKLLWKMAVFLGAGALLVFLADAIMPMAGIVYRYMADFSVVVLLISCIAFMSIWKEVQDKRSIRIIQLALHMCLLTSFLFHINFYWLTGLKYPLIWGNTSLYYKIYYSFMFW